jgi:transcriptional regulator with XRE-family HTH domain
MLATLLLKENIRELLRKRGHTAKQLARHCHRTESWISKTLSDPNRRIPSIYYDRIADFFGLTVYQLFQPGISPLTERRIGRERRRSGERRIGHAQRQAQDLAAHVEAHRPRQGAHADAAILAQDNLAAVLDQLGPIATQLHQLVAAADPRGQAPPPRAAVAGTRRRDQSPRRSPARENPK